MKKRIGNDIQFTWHIYRKSGESQTPESFDGKEVEVKLISPLQRPVTIEDVTIATGVVTFTFRGKHQVTLGNYVAVLQENKGEDGMVTLDVVDAVTLVPHSYMEEDGDDGDVIEAASVELESTITAGGGGGIEQQQADWAQTDASAVDYIKNKPDLDVYVPKMDNDGHGNMTIYSQGNIMMTLADKQGVINQTGSFSAGGWSVSSPDGRFQTFGNSIYRGTIGFDQDSVVWEKTAIEQIPAATTEKNGLMSADDKQKITDIEAVIPAQASSSNQLADKDFVNSSIATATATYRGAYNLVTDLSLTISATHAQIATALATAIQTADNNDYCFVQIPTADDTPTEIARIDRYKYDGTAWAYEYSLNNSGFTAAQWAALNSDITSGLVTKLSDLPTNSELTTLLNGKANTDDLAAVATSGSYNDLADKPTIPTVPTNVSAFNNDVGYITEDDVDDVPTADSDNPVKSGGVYDTTPSITDTDVESDLDVSDEDGNVLMRLSDGHIKTKNFNSELYARIISGVDYDGEVVPVTDANAILSYKQHKSIGSFDFDFKWVGACMAANGRIYGITNGNRQVLEINPETDTYCLFGNLSSGSFKWSGCGIGKNGMIYGYPRSANSVLIIDPVTQGVEEVDLGTNYEQNHHYGGCIVGDYMYLAPRAANHILKINLRTWQIERLGENILTYIARYSACIYHPNGYIYFIPEYNAKVLKLNPLNDAITELGSVLQSCSVYGASVAPNNKCIYGFTNRTNGGILKIDVVNNDTISFIHEGTVGTGYYSTELALNGKLYSGVGNGTDVWELDPTNDTVTIVDTISDTVGGDYNEAKCAGGVLAENGSIYLIPAKGRHIYKLEFDGQVVRTMSRKVLMSNYFSNY